VTVFDAGPIKIKDANVDFFKSVEQNVLAQTWQWISIRNKPSIKRRSETPPAKTRPKKPHNYRENATTIRTTSKKTANSRELALGLLWNNSPNTGKTQLLPIENSEPPN
jgi:hypothetical protein